MKIDTSEAKRWTVLNIEWNLVKIVDIWHTHMGRGGATYNFRVKNLVDGKVTTHTYKSGTILEGADVGTKSAVFLYSWWDTYTFLENDTSEMHEVNADDLEDIIPYLKENLDVYIMLYQDKVISVILPPTISYVIKDTMPWVKGDRAQAGKKPATLETWLEVQIPLHKEVGDTVTVNTSTKEAY